MNFVYAEFGKKVYLLAAHPDERYATQLYKTMAAVHTKARIFGGKGPNMQWRADGRLGVYEFALAYWRHQAPSVDLRPGEWINHGFDHQPAHNGARR